MLILLPPSEGKTPPLRGKPVDLGGLGFTELNPTRALVLQRLIEASSGPHAHAVLGVPATLGGQVRANLTIETAPTKPAGEIYSGVLFDALDLVSLDLASVRRARARILVVSALWGAVSLRDRIPAYRLSMNTNLPGIGPLAALWRQPLETVLPTAAGNGLIVDCRSAPYAAAWKPTGALARRWVAVRVFQEYDGTRTVVSHMAKHTRGLIARAIVVGGMDPKRPADLRRRLAEDFGESIDFELTAASRPGQPHYLDAIVTGPPSA